jgi:LAO/AO transport system kinase
VQPSVDQVKLGNRRAIARLMTQVENDEAAAHEAIASLHSATGRAHIIGVTGPPGSGKSTLVNEIAKRMRQLHLTVGIVAIDPSSPFTGGALLGDRIRMRDLSGDDGIFIRSMASRGRLGGLARMTGSVVKILDAAGYNTILIETVGAGQAEVDIASAAHTTLVIETPGMGDEIQTIKAGILEIADILVVNKVDRPGSDRTVKALRAMLHMGLAPKPTGHHGVDTNMDTKERTNVKAQTTWEVAVLETIALEGKGIDTTVDAILAHETYLRESGEWLLREISRSRLEVDQLLQAQFISQLQATVPESEFKRLIVEVAKREIDPYSAVNQLYRQMQM